MVVDFNVQLFYGVDIFVWLKYLVQEKVDIDIVLCVDGGGWYVGRIVDLLVGNWMFFLEISQDGECCFKFENCVFLKD